MVIRETFGFQVLRSPAQATAASGPFPSSSMTFRDLCTQFCVVAPAEQLLCLDLLPMVAATWSYSSIPARTSSSLGLISGGRGLPSPHWLEEALLYSCLWLIGSPRPDILQDFLHKQPERLRGTEGASGWNTCSIEVRCKILFDFYRVRVLPCSFN